jgi:hypothetical protein
MARRKAKPELVENVDDFNADIIDAGDGKQLRTMRSVAEKKTSGFRVSKNLYKRTIVELAQEVPDDIKEIRQKILYGLEEFKHLSNYYGPGKIEKLVTPKEFYKIAAFHHGLLSYIGAEFELPPYVVQKYIELQKMEKAILELREFIIDKAEYTVVNLLDSKNEDLKFQAAKFLLNNIGKQRGYSPTPLINQTFSTNPDEIKNKITDIFGITENNGVVENKENSCETIVEPIIDNDVKQDLEDIDNLINNNLGDE